MGSVSRGIVWCFIGCVCRTHFAHCQYDNIDSLILVVSFSYPVCFEQLLFFVNCCFLLLLPFFLRGGGGGGFVVFLFLGVSSLLSSFKGGFTVYVMQQGGAAVFDHLSEGSTVFSFQGRKRQGGIRFGEMERDALLAHGTSFLLQDRLMNCSDRTVVRIC